MFDRTKKVVHGIGVCAGVLVAGAMLAMTMPDKVKARSCMHEDCNLFDDDCLRRTGWNCTLGETSCDEERC